MKKPSPLSSTLWGGPKWIDVPRLNGPWVRVHRELSGVSCRRLARMAAVSAPHLSRFERGHTWLSREAELRVLAALRAS